MPPSRKPPETVKQLDEIDKTLKKANEPLRAEPQTMRPVTPTPENQPADPPHPLLEPMDTEDRLQTRELAIILCSIEHRKPFHSINNAPLWHSYIVLARQMIVAQEFLKL